MEVEIISCSKGETAFPEANIWAQGRVGQFVSANKISTLTSKLEVSELDLGWLRFLFPSRFAELININYKAE